MKRKGIPLRLLITVLALLLTVLFILLEIGQFYSRTANYIRNAGSALQEAEFTHAAEQASASLTQFETVARLTVGDEQLRSLLAQDATQGASNKEQICRNLNALLYKGRVIQQEVGSVILITGKTAYYGGPISLTNVSREEFLSYFLLSGGGWHFPGDPVDESMNPRSGLNKLKNRLFFVYPFTVETENDSLICVGAGPGSLLRMLPEALPAAILSPDGRVVLNGTSLSDESLALADPETVREAELSYGMRLVYEIGDREVSDTIRTLRKRVFYYFLLLLLFAASLSFVLSGFVTEPMKKIAAQLSEMNGETIRRPDAGKAPTPNIRERIIVVLLGTVLSSCILFSFISVHLYRGILEDVFRTTSENSFSQALWETENFFTNQRYATLYAAYDDQLITEMQNAGSEEADAYTDTTLTRSLESSRELFLWPTALSLYGRDGRALASTEPSRFDQSVLTTFPERGGMIWEMRKLFGTWHFTFLSGINDPVTLQTIGYLQTQTDERYLGDAYENISRAGGIAYLCRENGQILSSSDRTMIGETVPEEGDRLRYEAAIEDTPVTLSIDYDRGTFSGERQDMLVRTLILLFVIAFLTLLISSVLARYLTKRLTKVLRELTALTPENAAAFVPEESMVSEIDQIQDAFFEMTERVEKLLDESVEAERREKALELSRENTRFAFLQAQINPHFLYNSFEAISFMIRCEEKEMAISMLGSLSAMLRYAVRTGETVSPLREEIRYAKTYMEIMEKRYEGLLSSYFDFAPETEGLMIVRFTLQPILENAISHGFRSRGGRGTVRVTGTVAGGRLVIAVRDDGVGMAEETLKALEASLAEDGGVETGRHIGLRNIHSRIRALYGQGYGIQVSSKSGSGCVVTIMMPRIEEGKGTDKKEKPDTASESGNGGS